MQFFGLDVAVCCSYCEQHTVSNDRWRFIIELFTPIDETPAVLYPKGITHPTQIVGWAVPTLHFSTRFQQGQSTHLLRQGIYC
jgi:hypothetical protein